MMVVLGFAVALIGAILVALGVTGAAMKLFADKGQGFSGVEPGLADLLAQIPKIIDSLIKAPAWMAMIILGLVILMAGVGIARYSSAKANSLV